MSVSDPIADMLAKVRNGGHARLPHVDVPASKVKVRLLELMKRQGFIRSFQPMAVGVKQSFRVYLKFLPGRKPAINTVRRVSRPGLRQYCGADHVPHVINSRGIAVLSTSRGLMTDREARQARVGGEVLCYLS